MWVTEHRQACIKMLRMQLKTDIKSGDVKRVLPLGWSAKPWNRVQDYSGSDKALTTIGRISGEIIKNLVVQSSGHLVMVMGEAVGDYRKMVVSHDMTRKEREEFPKAG